MNDFETKPIDPKRLFLVLAKWLPPASAEQPEDVLAADATVAAVAGTEACALETETEEEPSIDLSVLGKLLENDPVKVARFAWRFVLSARATLTQMEAALARHDLEALSGLCHYQKSAASSAGAPALAALYQGLENASKADNWAGAQVLLAQLQPLLERIEAKVARETAPASN